MKLKQFFKKLKIQFGLVTIILIAVFATLLALDLMLKSFEVKYDWNFTVIPNFIWVESGVPNYGAAFSFLADTAWGRIFLIVLSCIMLVAVVVFFIFLPERFVVLKTALTMIGAGALGNLIDRFSFGYVRDFIWMKIFFGKEACCNFADFCIVLGVILAIADILFFNEWAVFPLTKRAKARVAARENREEQGKEAEGEEQLSATEVEWQPVDVQAGDGQTGEEPSADTQKDEAQTEDKADGEKRD